MYVALREEFEWFCVLKAIYIVVSVFNIREKYIQRESTATSR